MELENYNDYTKEIHDALDELQKNNIISDDGVKYYKNKYAMIKRCIDLADTAMYHKMNKLINMEAEIELREHLMLELSKVRNLRKFIGYSILITTILNTFAIRSGSTSLVILAALVNSILAGTVIFTRM